MKKFVFFLTLALLALGLAGCDFSQPAAVNQEQADNNLNKVSQEEPITEFPTNYELVLETGDGLIGQVKNSDTGEIAISNVKELCGQNAMLYTKTNNSAIFILQPYNPGAGLPLRKLLRLNAKDKTCASIQSYGENFTFGIDVLSPDHSLLAIAFDTDGAKTFRVIDLVNDVKVNEYIVNQGETLNAGYGDMSNEFEIKWLDDSKIQYAVFKDTPQDPDNPATLRTKIGDRVVEVK